MYFIKRIDAKFARIHTNSRKKLAKKLFSRHQSFCDFRKFAKVAKTK